MQISVSGRHMDIGDAFKQHARDRLNAIVDKYFDRALDAAVTLSKEAHLYRIDCTLHANQGTVLKARADGNDIYGTFDGVADKIEKQLRRYKRRLKNHHNLSRRKGVEVMMAQDYVLAPEEDPDDAEQGGINSHDPADDQPVIVAETSREIPTVSVKDAVMMLDLSEETAMIFRDQRSGELAMVYMRADGNIGWVDPSAGKSGTN